MLKTLNAEFMGGVVKHFELKHSSVVMGLNVITSIITK